MFLNSCQRSNLFNAYIEAEETADANSPAALTTTTTPASASFPFILSTSTSLPAAEAFTQKRMCETNKLF